MAKINQLQRTLKTVSKLTPREEITPFDLRRLCSNVILNKKGCWQWEGARNKKGYGQTTHEGRHFIAHRLFYKLFKGELLDKLQICHHCDNPSCCNPDHLFIGTNKDNVQDSLKKGRRTQSFSAKHVAYNASLDKKEAGKIVAFLAYNPETTSGMLADKFKIPIHVAKDIKRGRSYNNLIEYFECETFD